MTVSIDTSSIQITVNGDVVRPMAQILNFSQKMLPTRPGSAVFFTINEKTPTFSGAFKADARVSFLMGPGDKLDDWKVGFVQIVRQTATRTRYAGRTPLEGSIVCDVLPGFAIPKVLLDCESKAVIPFYFKPDGKSEFKGSVATPHTEDNPNERVPLFIQNGAVAKVNNFLYDFHYDHEFWTILTAIGPGQSPQYLAHFHWRLVHKVDFFWRSGVPSTSEWGSFKLLDKFVTGPPTDPDLQPILTSPVGPIANDIFSPAFDKSINGNDPLTHSESARGLSPMRLDFWGVDLPPNVG